MKFTRLVVVLVSMHLQVATVSATDRPVPVSPGAPDGLTTVEARCPTFSWGPVEGARGYELAVYGLRDASDLDGDLELVLSKRLSVAATSWTPPWGQALRPGGEYAWSVRAWNGHEASDWSEASLFEILVPAPVLAERDPVEHEEREKREVGPPHGPVPRPGSQGFVDPTPRETPGSSIPIPPGLNPSLILEPQGPGVAVGVITQGGSHGFYANHSGNAFVAEQSGGFAFYAQTPTKGLVVVTPRGRGIEILQPGEEGIVIDQPGRDGIVVDQAADYGVRVSADVRAGHFTSSGGSGITTATVFAENGSSGQGIAGWFEANGTDAALVVDQDGTGEVLKGFSGGNLRFVVENDGDVFADGAFTGGGADFAEFLPRRDLGETLEPGDVVGLLGGAVSRRTTTADRALVVTSHALVLGNRPSAEELEAHVPVVLVGQSPVKVRGPVRRGDLLVASGREDGTAIPVTAAALEPEQLSRLVGRALESSSARGPHRVQALIGIQDPGILVRLLRDRDERIARQEARIRALEGRIGERSPE